MNSGRAGWIVEQPIAHRGLHDMNRTVWENTATAFEHAAQAGYPIECDVQISADNVAMVFHDYMTDRLCGAHMILRQRTAEEIGSLHVGSTKDRIPKLASVLKQIRGRVGIIVEIKPQSIDDAAIVARSVLSAVEGYQSNLALMSFDQRIVKRVDVGRAAFGNQPAGQGIRLIPVTAVHDDLGVLGGHPFSRFCRRIGRGDNRDPRS